MSELDQYRSEIDAIDRELAALFLRRMGVTEKVGQYKLANGLAVLDPQRERQVIAAKTALTGDPAAKADLADLYQSIMAISRRQQRKLVKEEGDDPALERWQRALDARREPVAAPRVAYQGEPGCYSDEATAGFFGEGVQARGLPWFDDVFAALDAGEVDYAMLPIENSSTGSIRQVYDLLGRYDFSLVGEWQVKVEHCLAALPGVTLEDIETVYSHEQGLMQCDKFLSGHRDWKQVPVLDTAGSAKQVSETADRHGAAICSVRAARLYGLNVLQERINHNAANVTRFVVVSPKLELREGRDKIAALFSLPHQTGSLHEILSVFAVQGFNLTKIESRPIPGRDWEYLFFLEFTGDILSPGMEGVLRELSQLSADFRVLGNFKGYEG